MAASKKEDWMQSKWRPAMGWLYMITCAFDFVIFPVLWSILQASMKFPITQWNPLTLQGAGLYHLAMGAVLGVAAWSRGQEKIASIGVSSNGSPPSGGFGGSNIPQGNGFGSNNLPTTGWNQPTTGTVDQSNSNNSWSSITTKINSLSQTPTSEPLPPPPVKPGVRLSDNPKARMIIPEDPTNDADGKIK